MYYTNDKSKQSQRLGRPTARQQCGVDRIITTRTAQAGCVCVFARVFVRLPDSPGFIINVLNFTAVPPQ